MERATLGGGCFWCLEAVYQEVRGVEEVVSGYAGGDTPDPDYPSVSSGRTGHAEVVQITFDPEVVSYEDLLRIFFTIHDPTSRDRQGGDVGPQYRSIILTHHRAQERSARSVMDEIGVEGLYPGPLVTQVRELESFHPAEPEHQNYYRTHRWRPYCRVVIDPKIALFRQRFGVYRQGRAG
ncbi:MAG: peptide-methionine (S)-S-oxide reductase MsrA [Gemmatimonadota bacterium]|jgi:peptide-methionine (S)-S-oxide reductase